ncbi:thiamine pyrophosphate-binding protein [Actinorugispora endophytica]|uniref:Benzoylformate decarboxylase n=1 Tax=Actinorugispora endophytica TaxID=1605990 RepID=A0A4R6UK10_9ACTN|nr:thiamine pyrophosphate-binding protein [Actinorugispora endophytica]TDQ46892.1 benzoylformate decarboxylase [Actinorugispora endophytica]
MTRAHQVPPRPGRAALFEQFRADGITRMFGNPGTVEQGFLDALEDFPDFHYVLALQETVAAGIADGYARATGGPALLQLHSGVGLGNGIGMLYQSRRGHTPLVCVAGEAGVRYDAMDAQMAADLVAMARPVTKWAARATDPSSLLRMVRRAVKIAMTPPRGPVFLALPMDVLDAVTTEPALPTSIPTTRAVCAPDVAEQAARLLAGARRPLVLVGDGVALSGAQEELARAAEALGAMVWQVDSSEVNIPADHPLSAGQTGHMFGHASRAVVADADAVLIVGTYVFPEVFADLASPFAPDARIVHVDLDGYEIAKNHPVDLGVVADPAPTLAAITDALVSLRSAADAEAARGRLEDARAAARGRVTGAARPAEGEPLLAAFMRELSARLDDDTVVFDEALTASGIITDFLPPRIPGRYHLTRGGSLGVGFPGAVGAKLAHPDRTVIGFSGDGGSMYTYQALWTAARYGVAARFVVCNNGRYQLLDSNIDQYWRERGIAPRDYPSGFDLSRPDIRFAEVARGLGVAATRVDKAEQVPDAVDRMLACPGPFLVDLHTG